MQTDVTQRAEFQHFVDTCSAALGRLPDILVNNAGCMHYTLLRNLHQDAWEREIDVNCKGVVNGVGAVLSGTRYAQRRRRRRMGRRKRKRRRRRRKRGSLTIFGQNVR